MLLPSASQSTIDYISNDLYSLEKFGGPKAEFERTKIFNAEALINRNFYALQNAFNDQGFAYQFSVPPATHTQDIAYTLYNGHNDRTGKLDSAIAMDMQR